MRSPLVYLTAVKLKNQLKAVVKSPAKLLYGLFLVAMFALVAFSKSETVGSDPRNLSELVAILTIFYTIMFLMVFVSGSASNTPMFTLSDVTLLFPAPLSPNRILFYGLFRQLGVSLLLGFFLLFQYSWLNMLYGITYGHLLLIVLGYALTLFLAQFCAMAVYTRTSGKDRAGRTVRICVYAAAVLYVAAAAFVCWEPLSALLAGGSDYEAALAAGSSFFSTFPGLLFPVSGWAAGVVGGLFTGDWMQCAIGLGLTALLFAALIGLIVKSKNNYYEDVLQTAETAQSAVTAKKEGQLTEAVPKNVKIGKIGLGKGLGASAIYYKHKVENRRSGVFLLSNMALIFAVIIIVTAFFMRSLGSDAIVAVFAMGTYMQLFSVALGRFSRELIKPYIYLIPEPPLKKLLYTIKESIIADSIEAVIIFVPVAFIISASPLDIVFCILARISFSLLFTAGNVLVERVFGTVSSKVLIFFFYFLALILMAVPGIILGSVLLAAASLGYPGLFLGMALLNVLISVLVLYLCRNLLQYAELNNK